MSRITIKDLPKNQEITKREMKGVTGGFGRGGSLGWLTNPWALAGIVATAIAIPLATHDHDDDAS